MDLAEAESELVSGFMTEHSAVIFVFFFLAEYASIVLICLLMSVLFFGGYLLFPLVDLYINNVVILGFMQGVSLAFKASLLVFGFIWVRASFPRIRFDQLMKVCWTAFLPVLFGLMFLVFLIPVSLDSLPLSGINLIIPGLIAYKSELNNSGLKNKPLSVTDEEFHQWLVGFTDGEGNFYIRIAKDETISFSFSIKLHIDDLKVLEFIKFNLNCGSIQILTTENSAYYRVGGVNQIIDILFPILTSFLWMGLST